MEVRASADLDPAPLENVAATEVVDGVIALFERQRSSGSGAVETDVVLHASVVEIASDRATVEDCVLISPSITDTVGVWHQADLARTEQGWIVEAVRIPSGGGCVPQAIADEAIAGYEAYYEAGAGFWDPPDPGHPLIIRGAGRTTEEPDRRASRGTRGARAWRFRGRPIIHPEVIEVRSPTELVISSC